MQACRLLFLFNWIEKNPVASLVAFFRENRLLLTGFIHATHSAAVYPTQQAYRKQPTPISNLQSVTERAAHTCCFDDGWRRTERVSINVKAARYNRRRASSSCCQLIHTYNIGNSSHNYHTTVYVN